MSSHMDEKNIQLDYEKDYENGSLLIGPAV